jgi:hypothetical protein
VISKQALKTLVFIREKDAKALFEKRRYSAAIYMAGYAIEIGLKYEICKMYFFSKGFPESKIEFQSYFPQRGKKYLLKTIESIGEIRHHDLQLLLSYSGLEFKIKSMFLSEWNLISGWKPEMRYRITPVRKSEAGIKLSAVSTIIKGIL